MIDTTESRSMIDTTESRSMIDTTPPAPTGVGTAADARLTDVTRAAQDDRLTATSQDEWRPNLSERAQGTEGETTGADANSDPESVPPLRCDADERGLVDPQRGDLTDMTWAVFLELRPQFEGLLPQSVVLDCVEHAVQDLLASMSVEALPEMAVRLAWVRLERHRLMYQPPDAGAAGGAADRSVEVRKTFMIGPGPAFTVIRRPTPECPLVAVTVTMTQVAS